MDPEPYIELTKWGFKWLRYVFKEAVGQGYESRLAKRVLAAIDDNQCDPEEYLEVHEYVSSHRVSSTLDPIGTVEERRLTKKRVRRGRRTDFAISVSKLAYNKFGKRVMTEANVLVTRKWIQKLLEEPKYKDMRTCDKNVAIDRAIFLSFVPTFGYSQLERLIKVGALAERIEGEPTSCWRWAPL